MNLNMIWYIMILFQCCLTCWYGVDSSAVLCTVLAWCGFFCSVVYRVGMVWIILQCCLTCWYGVDSFAVLSTVLAWCGFFFSVLSTVLVWCRFFCSVVYCVGMVRIFLQCCLPF